MCRGELVNESIRTIVLIRTRTIRAGDWRKGGVKERTIVKVGGENVRKREKDLKK